MHQERQVGQRRRVGVHAVQTEVVGVGGDLAVDGDLVADRQMRRHPVGVLVRVPGQQFAVVQRQRGAAEALVHLDQVPAGPVVGTAAAEIAPARNVARDIIR